MQSHTDTTRLNFVESGGCICNLYIGNDCFWVASHVLIESVEAPTMREAIDKAIDALRKARN